MDIRARVEREVRAWTESIELDDSQDHALYRPGRVMQARISLAHLDRNPYGRPSDYDRIEVQVDSFATDGSCRRGAHFDASPTKFASEGSGFGPMSKGVGQLTPDEWEDAGVAFVWWRPHDESLLAEYRPGVEGVFDGVDDRWDVPLPVRVVGGPEIPNNRLEPPHRHRVWMPWVFADPRQLDIFGETHSPEPQALPRDANAVGVQARLFEPQLEGQLDLFG